jgi:hypothetical protein
MNSVHEGFLKKIGTFKLLTSFRKIIWKRRISIYFKLTSRLKTFALLITITEYLPLGNFDKS